MGRHGATPVRSAEPDAERGRRRATRASDAKRRAAMRGSVTRSKKGAEPILAEAGTGSGWSGCVASGCDAHDRDAELAGFVDEVAGDAGAGERDDAGGQEVEELVVAAEGCCLAVGVPVRACR